MEARLGLGVFMRGPASALPARPPQSHRVVACAVGCGLCVAQACACAPVLPLRGRSLARPPENQDPAASATAPELLGQQQPARSGTENRRLLTAPLARSCLQALPRVNAPVFRTAATAQAIAPNMKTFKIYRFVSARAARSHLRPQRDPPRPRLCGRRHPGV